MVYVHRTSLKWTEQRMEFWNVVIAQNTLPIDLNYERRWETKMGMNCSGCLQRCMVQNMIIWFFMYFVLLVFAFLIAEMCRFCILKWAFNESACPIRRRIGLDSIAPRHTRIHVEFYFFSDNNACVRYAAPATAYFWNSVITVADYLGVNLVVRI